MKPVLPEKARHIPVKAFGQTSLQFCLVPGFGKNASNVQPGREWPEARYFGCRVLGLPKIMPKSSVCQGGMPLQLSTKQVIFLARPQHGIRALEKWQLCRQTAASEMMFRSVAKPSDGSPGKRAQKGCLNGGFHKAGLLKKARGPLETPRCFWCPKQNCPEV